MSNVTKSIPETTAPTTEAPTTALAPYVGPLQRPTPGTPEGDRFKVEAGDMMAVLAMNETNPRAVVTWDGATRVVGDLVRAWRKATYVAESKRLHRK